MPLPYPGYPIYPLSSVSGMVEWVDYIPVQQETGGRAKSYDNSGYLVSPNVLTSVTGLVAWVDYIPVYEVAGRNTPWYVGADGYIPWEDVSSVPVAPTITTLTLDAMTQNEAFSQQLAATGTAPITWDVSAGTVPTGLTLSSSGLLSGTPTGSGAYDFTARATNSQGNDTQQYTGTITAADVTAPILSSPTDVANGGTAGTLNVTTDEGNGTLYWVVTTSATTPTHAQIVAGNDHTGSAAADSGSQAVTGTGAQGPIAATGLSSETTYYAHFTQVDAATNAATPVSADGFTTADITAPTLSSPTDVANGETAGTIGVTTNEGNGTLYWVVTQSATSPSAAQVQAGQDHTGSAADDSGSQAVSGTGVQGPIATTGLTADTTYYAHFCHVDSSTNASSVASADGFTTDASATFSPADLFASTEEGVWFDPSDLSTLWTDDGVTQASVNDAIYRMDDKSGNGHHAYQTTAASRPILRQDGNGDYYLEFDGSDDFMETENYTITGPDQWIMVAWQPDDLLSASGVLTRGSISADESATRFTCPNSASALSRWHSYYGGASVYSGFNGGATGAQTDVQEMTMESGVGHLYYVSGTLRDSNDTIGTLGTPASLPTTIGAGANGGGTYGNGRIYQFFHIDRLPTGTEQSDLRTFIADKSGVTLA